MRANGESIHQEKDVNARGVPATLSAVASGIAVLIVAIFVSGCGLSGVSSGIPVYKSSGRTWATYPKVKQTGTVMTTEGILQPLGVGMQSVDAVVPDGSGGFYIGGDFTEVGGLTRNNIAHILSDGTVDESWNPDANSGVSALATDGPNVYAGGGFTTIGGETRNHIACLDSSGAATPWDPNANLYVCALAVAGPNIYVGGGFTTIGGQTRTHIACLDSSGAATPWDPKKAEKSVLRSVKALAVSGSYVYVGGDFTTIGGKARNHVACLDSSGAATSWDPDANGDVEALAVSGSFNPIGGQNRTIGGQTRNYVACLDSSGAATSWNPIIRGGVYAIGVSDSTVYVGCSPQDERYD